MPVAPGDRFGRLTVISADFPSRDLKVLCRCDCGAQKMVNRYSLVRGRTRSCGCYRREHSIELGRATAKYAMEAGDTFGYWTVLDASDRAAVLCRCSCGTERTVAGYSLGNGDSRSCGCLKATVAAAIGDRVRTHGLSRHELYGTWAMIIERCCNPAAINYERYGRRGVGVFGPWFDVATFIGDVEREIGRRPQGHTIDRIDNDGNYEPGNLRWATAVEQAANRRPRSAPGRPI